MSMRHRRINPEWFWLLNVFKPSYFVAILFTFAAIILNGEGQMRAVGMLLVGVALAMQCSRRTSLIGLGRLPWDCLGYLLWGIWGIITGPLVTPSWFGYMWAIRLTVQMMALVFAAYAVFRRMTDSRWFYLAVVGSSLILALMSSGRMEGLTFMTTVKDSGLAGTTMEIGEGRLAAVGRNPNAVAFIMLSAIWAIVMLYNEKLFLYKFLKFPIAIAGMSYFSYILIQTGSRKTVLGLGLFVVVWLLWVLPKKIKVSTVIFEIFMVIVIIVGSRYAIQYVMQDTIAGRRMQEGIDAGGGSLATNFKEGRGEMYKAGVKLWARNPLMGVGPGGFGVASGFYVYSHSDYIEPLANTGTVGFLLYHACAFSIFLRLIRFLLKKNMPDEGRYQAKGLVLYLLINHYFVGLGAPWWCDMFHMYTLMFCSALSLRLWRNYTISMYPRNMMRVWS